MTRPIPPPPVHKQQLQIEVRDDGQFIAELNLIARIDEEDRDKTAESRKKWARFDIAGKMIRAMRTCA